MFDASTIYLAIAILAFVLILTALFLQRKKTKELSRLTLLALMLVFAGGAVESRLIGYLLVGIGILVAAYEFIKNRKKNSQQIADKDL